MDDIKENYTYMDIKEFFDACERYLKTHTDNTIREFVAQRHAFDWGENIIISREEADKLGITFSRGVMRDTIYQCIKPDARYKPTLMNIVHKARTAAEAIEWLENNGGGVYRNLLHQFDMAVAPKED